LNSGGDTPFSLAVSGARNVYFNLSVSYLLLDISLLELNTSLKHDYSFSSHLEFFFEIFYSSRTGFRVIFAVLCSVERTHMTLNRFCFFLLSLFFYFLLMDFCHFFRFFLAFGLNLIT